MNVCYKVALAILMTVCLAAPTSSAQSLKESVEGIFAEVLDVNLAGPGAHGNHFLPSNVSTSQAVISSLGNLISTSASQFPLSSTSVGLTFDLSTGVPVATRTSAGPIFGERGQTLGKGRLNLGFNYSTLDLAKVRGLNTDEISFVFLHQNIGNTSIYGDDPNEHDYIVLDAGLDLDATVLAIYGTYGLSDRLDVGIAIPYVRISLKADPFARMNSYTFTSNGSANHYFGGTSASPELTLNGTDVDESAGGIGDITFRAKLHAYQGQSYDIGLLAEMRIATGKEEDFLGSGDGSFKGLLIASTSSGYFSPYGNLGFEVRSGELNRDRFFVGLGFDQKLSDLFTLAVEWTGEFETGEQPAELTFPDEVPILGPVGATPSTVSQTVQPTNIPSYENDHITNASFGLKWTPTAKFLAYANIILPTNDGGLRSNAITTIGIEFNL